MNFNKLINSILKEEMSRENRIKALKALDPKDSIIFVDGFIDDREPGINLEYKGMPFSAWWISNKDVFVAIRDQATKEQQETVERLRVILDNLIKYRDTHDIETYRIGLDKIKHTVEFGYVTYDHHSVEA